MCSVCGEFGLDEREVHQMGVRNDVRALTAVMETQAVLSTTIAARLLRLEDRVAKLEGRESNGAALADEMDKLTEAFVTRNDG